MKKLVVCCDGTWQSEENENPTNVRLMAEAVLEKSEDACYQLVYYHPGVGTRNIVDKVLGGVNGTGLDENILDAYRFLVLNYSGKDPSNPADSDDELFLFGFSRGAYTARSLAGLIRNCGILRRSNLDHLQEAIRLYRHRDPDLGPNSNNARAFRRLYTYSEEPPIIHFVGVWDTVGSLGIPSHYFDGLNDSYRFHDTTLSSHVANAFHALSIDEKRADFRPTLWSASDRPPQLRFEQVWFAGCHSDVGGGFPEAGLSNIAFNWMVHRAKECGLSLNPAQTEDPMGPRHNSSTGIWRLARAENRQLGVLMDAKGEYTTTSDTRQAIHASVKARWGNEEKELPPADGFLQHLLTSIGHRHTEAGYSPVNLNEALTRITWTKVN